jgi:restriction endonuclease S subunit
MMEWKKLGELGRFENIGTDKKIVEGEKLVTLLNYVDVYHHKYINISVPQMQVSASNKKIEDCTVEQGDIFVTPSSETVDDIGHSSVITETIPNAVYSYHIMRYRLFEKNMLLSYYINYSFDTDIVKKQILKKAQGLTRFGLSKDKFASIQIPIPSLPEQKRIVGILDTFTASIENLKEQIAQRRKQYEYYRDQLLDLEGKEGVEINHVAKFVKERILANELTAQNYTSVENLLKDKAGRKDAENVPTDGNWIKYQKGDVLIGNIRPYLRKIWLSDREGGTNGDVIVLRAKDTLLPEFMFYCLASESFFIYYNQALKDGKMPRGEKNRVLSYVIPSIKKEEQQRIVSILDTFEASIQNLESQLSQREKQYEYYRNKLLTFD